MTTNQQRKFNKSDEREATVLAEFIRQYRELGYCPLSSEIAEACGIKHTMVWHYLETLVAKGKLTRVARVRGYRPIEEKTVRVGTSDNSRYRSSSHDKAFPNIGGKWNDSLDNRIASEEKGR